MTASLLILISLLCGSLNTTKADKLICIKQVSPCASALQDSSTETSEADDVLTCLEKVR